MTRARIRMVVVAVAGLAIVPAFASAQGTGGARRFKVGVAAGATVPLGDFGDGAKTGFHVGGLIDYDMLNSPLSLRGEVTWHRNDVKDDVINAIGIDDANTTILAFTGNVLYRFGMQPGAQMVPYLIGGAGVYNNKATFEVNGESDSDSDTKFGLNGGIGIRIPLAGFTTNIEARYHTVFTEDSNANFIPLSVSIIF
jgi:opacity protein-like surface antigen